MRRRIVNRTMATFYLMSVFSIWFIYLFSLFQEYRKPKDNIVISQPVTFVKPHKTILTNEKIVRKIAPNENIYSIIRGRFPGAYKISTDFSNKYKIIAGQTVEIYSDKLIIIFPDKIVTLNKNGVSEKALVTRYTMKKGKINKTLSQSLSELKVKNPHINIKIPVRQNSEFKVLVKENLYNGKVVSDKVLYIQINNKKLYSSDGIRFDTPGILNYAYPTYKYKINSRYGVRRVHPISGVTQFHHGTDIAGHSGDIVMAIAAGKVTFSGWKGGYGRTVIIKHNNGSESLYAHLSDFSVTANQVVIQGQKIGKVGSSGSATGPHLHIELKINGKRVNPELYLGKKDNRLSKVQSEIQKYIE